MQSLGTAVVTASVLFVGTNLDDIVVLAILNISSRTNGRPKAWHIWTGQCLGMVVLVAISLLAALGLTLVPDNRTWLLGLAPLAMGLHRLIVVVREQNAGARPSTAVATGLAGVTAVTVANGGDNIAAYTAVFRTSARGEIAVMLAVFMLGAVLWCAIGAWIPSHRRITEVFERWGHWMVPAVFIGIGAFIFYKGGVLGF